MKLNYTDDFIGPDTLYLFFAEIKACQSRISLFALSDSMSVVFAVYESGFVKVYTFNELLGVVIDPDTKHERYVNLTIS